MVKSKRTKITDFRTRYLDNVFRLRPTYPENGAAGAIKPERYLSAIGTDVAKQIASSTPTAVETPTAEPTPVADAQRDTHLCR